MFQRWIDRVWKEKYRTVEKIYDHYIACKTKSLQLLCPWLQFTVFEPRQLCRHGVCTKCYGELLTAGREKTQIVKRTLLMNHSSPKLLTWDFLTRRKLQEILSMNYGWSENTYKDPLKQILFIMERPFVKLSACMFNDTANFKSSAWTQKIWEYITSERDLWLKSY